MLGKKVALVAGLLAGGGAMACAFTAVGREPRLGLHQCDWSLYEEGLSRRSYRNLSHFLHHFKELLSVQVPVAEIYLGRAISPAFRERIMLVTAMANQCAW